MFDRKYVVKIYLEGQAEPVVSFFVLANQVVAEGHTVKIDGIVLRFADNQYVTAQTC